MPRRLKPGPKPRPSDERRTVRVTVLLTPAEARRLDRLVPPRDRATWARDLVFAQLAPVETDE